ncbi:hypothetical protein CAPTEDRAFT_88039, partial [Capitella teleta]
EQRIRLKVCLLMHKAVTGDAPQFLCDLVYANVPNRTLRSSHELHLHIPFTRSHLVKTSCFSYIEHFSFNSLPLHVKYAQTV